MGTDVDALISTGSVWLDSVIPIVASLAAGLVALHKYYLYLKWRSVKFLAEIEKYRAEDDGMGEVIALAKEEACFNLLFKRISTREFRDAIRIALNDRTISVYQLKMAARHLRLDENQKLYVPNNVRFNAERVFYWFYTVISVLMVLTLPIVAIVSFRGGESIVFLSVMFLLFVVISVWSIKEVVGFEIAVQLRLDLIGLSDGKKSLNDVSEHNQTSYTTGHDAKYTLLSEALMDAPDVGKGSDFERADENRRVY